MASVKELASGAGATIDLCGQHEHQRLLTQGSHVDLLDAWAQDVIAEPLAAYQAALKSANAAAKELARIEEMSRTARERVDEAAFVVRRIDEVGPKEGELDELEEQLPRAEHAESLMRAASEAREALAGDDGALDLVGGALQELRDAARHDASLERHIASLESALIDLEDVAAELRDYADTVEYDPERLDEMQTRMAQLRGLMRTYGPTMEQVLRRRMEAAEVVSAAEHGDTMVADARRARDEAERTLVAAADALDGVRAKAAPQLARAVTEQMAYLEMGTAELEVELTRLERNQWTASGPSRVELAYRPAQGMVARPLRRIASGGEISRVMLALKVVLGEADATETLVFDEVDAGVGGATAVALAAVLARLAETHQVIVVTHLAQVAVRGQRHYLVSKSQAAADGVPVTTITEIAGDDRVAEIARMLSGDVGEASLAHAREMLAAV
jgi:DNA repair protein RecN (Recombination protein N)